MCHNFLPKHVAGKRCKIGRNFRLMKLAPTVLIDWFEFPLNGLNTEIRIEQNILSDGKIGFIKKMREKRETKRLLGNFAKYKI